MVLLIKLGGSFDNCLEITVIKTVFFYVITWITVDFARGSQKVKM